MCVSWKTITPIDIDINSHLYWHFVFALEFEELKVKTLIPRYKMKLRINYMTVAFGGQDLDAFMLV